MVCDLVLTRNYVVLQYKIIVIGQIQASWMDH